MPNVSQTKPEPVEPERKPTREEAIRNFVRIMLAARADRIRGK